MPCRSDYMEPTNKERRLRETAELLMHVLYNTNTGIKVDSKLKGAARDIHCKEDYVPMLCEVLHSLSTEDFDRLVYNARCPTSRKLADWWDEHLKADAEREKAEESRRNEAAMKESIRSKLTPDEIAFIMNGGLKNG